jgi:2-hydroxychromene-2-carboxylate isomerase
VPPTAGSSTADLKVVRTEGGGADALPAFYFDVGSPECYLAAERVLSLMPVPCEWIPVAGSELPGGAAHEGMRCAEEETIFRAEFERTVAARGLQPVLWPGEFPFDSGFAQRAATYAKGGGKTVAFALAAFRQAFAGGRDLSVPDNVMIAGAACEIHPRALLKGAATAGVERQLQAATATALERGVRSVPAVWTPSGDVFHGDAGLEAAAAALSS